MLGAELGGAWLGLRATFLLGTALGTLFFGHRVMAEPFLALWITVTFWCFVKGLRHPERASLWMGLAWVAMGMGCLSEGLAGAAWPLVAAALAAWGMPSARPVLRHLIQGAGPLAFGLILAPWYALAGPPEPGFLANHFLTAAGNFLSESWGRPEFTQAPLLPFLFLHLALWLPWTFFIPTALVGWWDSQAGDSSSRAAIRLLGLGIGVIWGTALFSARQDTATLVSWGFLAIFLARALNHFSATSTGWRILPGLGLAGLGLATIGFAVVFRHAGVEGASLAGGESLFGPMVRAGLVGVVAGLGVSLLGWQQRADYAVAAAGGALVLVSILSLPARGEVQNHRSLAGVAKALQERALPESLIACEGEPHRSASLFFYLPRPIHWVGANPWPPSSPHGQGKPSPRFLGQDEFIRHWRYGRSVYFIVEEAKIAGEWQPRLGLTKKQAEPIARSGPRVLLWNGNR
jgi:4-amino-4-deoxy-L-arabinose transferase-like glycosyltransferase